MKINIRLFLRLYGLLIFVICLSPNIYSQTIIINEVSQGEMGAQEYIEFVVVDNTAFFDCGLTTPPCIDIRNWIVDDNSGYHGSEGIAGGALRFSNDALWSCVPLGTIILLYNDGDPNPEIPADDLTMADGNCTLIIPISNSTLIESNSTTPGALICDYPATGWTSGGNWLNIGMKQSEDCARLVDLNGCEVFSLGWGNTTLNDIYFSGTASNFVHYFNGTDPFDQVNWSKGCADLPNCGSQDQTPGAPNNAANAAYIAQFNNGCMPITPIANSVTPINSSCTCQGTATSSASGSIGPYTYEWFDDLGGSVGTGASISNLCDGDYSVVATSQIGCDITSNFSILNSASLSAGDDGSIDLCESDNSIDLFSLLTGNPDASGSWSGPSALSGGANGTLDPSVNLAGTYIYTVGGGGSCPDQAEVVVTMEQTISPTISAAINPICPGQSTTISIVGGSGNYLWDDATTNSSITVNTAGTYSVDVIGACNTVTLSLEVTEMTTPTITISNSGNNQICPGETITLTSTFSGNDIEWSNGETSNSIVVSDSGTYSATTNSTCGNAVSNTIVIIEDICEPNVPDTLIQIPNIFTPNGDGDNDEFHLLDIQDLTDAKGFIVNRWGQKMYNWKLPTDSWNGTTLKGKEAPSGTYFLILEYIYRTGKSGKAEEPFILQR